MVEEEEGKEGKEADDERELLVVGWLVGALLPLAVNRGLLAEVSWPALSSAVSAGLSHELYDCGAISAASSSSPPATVES